MANYGLITAIGFQKNLCQQKGSPAKTRVCVLQKPEKPPCQYVSAFSPYQMQARVFSL